MDEVIWVDENDLELGIVSRAEAHKQGLLHRIAVIYVTNKQGQILIQERINGRLDHSSAGHVDPGETYEQAAKRELEEELSISGVTLNKIAKSQWYEISMHSGKINHIYEIFTCSTEPGALKADEVKSVFWADPKEILQDMEQDTENKKYIGGFKDSLKHYLKQTN